MNRTELEAAESRLNPSSRVILEEETRMIWIKAKSRTYMKKPLSELACQGGGGEVKIIQIKKFPVFHLE